MWQTSFFVFHLHLGRFGNRFLVTWLLWNRLIPVAELGCVLYSGSTQSSYASSSTEKCFSCVKWWFQEERWSSGVPFQIPFTSLLHDHVAPLWPQEEWHQNFLTLNEGTWVLFIPAWNIALISGVFLLILLFSIGLNQRLSAWLVIPPWPRLFTLCLFVARWLLYLFSTAITLVTALKNWLLVFHLQCLGHVPHGRHHLPTTIEWNSPMQELIGSVMVSSLLG